MPGYTKNRWGTRKRGYKSRKFSRYGRKSRFKRRSYRNKRRISPFIRGLKGGLPPRVRVVLRYTETITINGVGSGRFTKHFRGNSPYDPEVSGGTDSNLFSFWATAYNRYTCHASKIKVTTFPTVDYSSQPSYTALMPINDTSTISAATPRDQIMAYSNSKIRYNRNQATGTTRMQNSQYRKSKTMLNKTNLKDEADASAYVDNNPFQQWYWMFRFGTVTGADYSTDTICDINITYYVEFWDKKDLYDQSVQPVPSTLAKIKDLIIESQETE